MLEGTSASAYVLCPFQTLVISEQEGQRVGDQRIGEGIGVVLGVELRE